MTDFTLALIKPEVVARNEIGSIITAIEENGFQIKKIRLVQMSLPLAEAFYAEHLGRDFFHDLTQWMSSGPVVALILEKPNAVLSWRTLIGATNPEEANEGTLRNRFGKSRRHNAVHGSDSPESAMREFELLFPTQ